MIIYDVRIMLSSLSSFDDELLNGAYANISLIADQTWVFNKQDLYRDLNQSLWVQSCKLIEKYKDKDVGGGSCPRYVRDVIPESRLSKYGNYKYNEEREKMYKSENNVLSVNTTFHFYAEEITEPWMLPEVEEYFNRLISGNVRRINHKISALKELQSTDCLQKEYNNTRMHHHHHHFKTNWNDVLQNNEHYGLKINSNGKKRTRRHGGESFTIYKHNNIDSDTIGKNIELGEYNKYKPPRYTIDAPTEIQLQACIFCENVRDLWNPMKIEQQQQQKFFVSPNKRLHYQQRQQQQPQQQCNRQEQHVNISKGQQQLYCALQYQPLALKMDYHQTRFQTDGYEIMRKPLAPNLSPEVPEFFPKFPVACINNHKEQRINPVQYFPSLNEKNFQKELFPYNRTYETVVVTSFQNVPTIPILPSIDTNHYMRTPHQWIQRVTGPGQIHIPVSSATQPIYKSLQTTCTNTINQRPQQVTPTSIPVYQRPLELYTDPSQIRKNNQGVDFNNLILLTKNAMKVRRSSSRNRQQSKQSKQYKKKTEQNIFQWLNKSCPKKTKELISVNTVVTELQNFENKCDCNNVPINKWKTNDESLEQKQITEHLKSNAWTMMENTDATTISNNDTEIEGDFMQKKKRLYRDVLTHTLTLSHIKLKI